MNCFHCHNKIDGKSWLHLSNLPFINEEGKNILVDKHICSYSCYKRLYDSNSIPKSFSSHIVNKEDYKNLIRPIPIQIKKEFEYLTYGEINCLTEEEKLKYISEKNKQIHLNPITYEIYDEIHSEDQKTSYLESLSSDDEVIYEDY